MNYIPVECKGPVVPVAVDLLGANQFLPLCTYVNCSRKTLIIDTLLHSASFFSTTPPWIFVSTAPFFHLKRRQEKTKWSSEWQTLNTPNGQFGRQLTKMFFMINRIEKTMISRRVIDQIKRNSDSIIRIKFQRYLKFNTNSVRRSV